MRYHVLLIVFCCVIPALSEQVSADESYSGLAGISWAKLSPLPDSFGFAGPFVGISGDALLVAGGANFPDKMPWNGGRKLWHDRIFILREPNGKWQTLSARLPEASGYGVSLSFEGSVICIGGCAENWNEKNRNYQSRRCYDTVVVLNWDAERGTLTVGNRLSRGSDEIRQAVILPKLPIPLAFMGAALVGDAIYVAGGQETMIDAKATTNFWRLDLSQRFSEKALQWERLPWPKDASPRVLPVCAAQHDGSEVCFYLFSGRDGPGHDGKPLVDGWKFSPAKYAAARNKAVELQIAAWEKVASPPSSIMAGCSVALPAPNIVSIGGDDGEHFGKNLRERHPGFNRNTFFTYDAVSNHWAAAGKLPANHVTTTAVWWHNKIIIPTGEIYPGIRTPEVLELTIPLPIKRQQHGESPLPHRQ